MNTLLDFISFANIQRMTVENHIFNQRLMCFFQLLNQMNTNIPKVWCSFLIFGKQTKWFFLWLKFRDIKTLVGNRRQAWMSTKHTVKRFNYWKAVYTQQLAHSGLKNTSPAIFSTCNKQWLSGLAIFPFKPSEKQLNEMEFIQHF